jgi:hypothetical protein
MKKSVVLKLPVTIEIDSEKKTCSIEYGKVPFVKMDDGSEVELKFLTGPQSVKYQVAK